MIAAVGIEPASHARGSGSKSGEGMYQGVFFKLAYLLIELYGR